MQVTVVLSQSSSLLVESSLASRTSTVSTYQTECPKTPNQRLSICAGVTSYNILHLGTLIAYWIDFSVPHAAADFPVAFHNVFLSLSYLKCLSCLDVLCGLPSPLINTICG